MASGRRYVRSVTDERRAIVGVWNLESIDGERVEGPPRPPHEEFGADGRVSGTGGVNRIIGSYELDGDTLTLRSADHVLALARARAAD